jgi:hypothetical protein
MKPFPTLTFRRCGVLALAFASLAFAGCASSVRVTEKTEGSYRLGELRVYTDRDFKAVHDAVPKAFKDLNLFQTKDELKVMEAELTARDGTDTRVGVDLKEVVKGRTMVEIRYGVPGDLAKAQKVYDAIEKNL